MIRDAAEKRRLWLLRLPYERVSLFAATFMATVILALNLFWAESATAETARRVALAFVLTYVPAMAFFSVLQRMALRQVRQERREKREREREARDAARDAARQAQEAREAEEDAGEEA